jgi:hypothetical protein
MKLSPFSLGLVVTKVPVMAKEPVKMVFDLVFVVMPPRWIINP